MLATTLAQLLQEKVNLILKSYH